MSNHVDKLYGTYITGLLTTPQLHFMVRCTNTNNEYGTPTEEGYYEKFTSSFIKLMSQVGIYNHYDTVLISFNHKRIAKQSKSQNKFHFE